MGSYSPINHHPSTVQIQHISIHVAADLRLAPRTRWAVCGLPPAGSWRCLSMMEWPWNWRINHWISWIGGSQWLQILQYKLCHDHVVSKTTIWIYLIGRIPLGFSCIYQVCHLRPYILAVFVAVLAVLYLLHGKRFPLKLWPLETNSRHDQHASVVSLGNTMSSSTSKHDVHTHVHKYIQI